MTGLRVEEVVAEAGRDGFALATGAPRLTWRVAPGPVDWQQTAYEIRRPDTGDTTGRVESGDSVFVAWPFAPLASRERAAVAVRVHGQDGSVSEWSDPLELEVALLEWQARPVGLDDADGVVQFERSFDVRAGAVRGRLYVTALGIFEPSLNGAPVGDHVLDPGWTSYDHRLLFSTFDVTPRLREGENVLAVLVADGWYRGRLGFNGGRRNIYGDRPGVLVELHLEYADGTHEVVRSDEHWRAGRGPIVEAGLYDGETIDARIELGDWRPVRELEIEARLEPAARPPVRRIERLQPVETTRLVDGAVRYDFGQNLVGWIALTAQGAPGDSIVVRHAEVLENGELALRPLRTARSTDTYVLAGTGAERFEPRFTFHGFRYAEVTGPVDRAEAVVAHSDLERTGWFECSEPDLNRLHANIVWSMRGNVVSLPTDCPQRDERLGWAGDVQVFGPTACFLYDADSFLASWLADVAAEQRDDGGLPNFVPDPGFDGDLPDDQPAAAWADAAVIVPWTLYERYGDVGVLERQYDSMRRWVDFVETRLSADGVWEHGWQYGDWLDPAAPPDEPWAARTEPALVATAYAAHTAQLLTRAAEVLGRDEDGASYAVVAERRRDAFVRRFVREDGRLTSDAQTAYALGIVFGLVDAAPAGARLAELVELNGFRIGTGFVGTPIVCDALTLTGHVDTAYRLVLQRECPSWLYPVTMGATTMWERWDSMLPDGSVNPGQMTSFNHYALGAVADWLHRVVAGLGPAEPGYRRLEIRPRPGGGLTSASARLRTPYGVAKTAWTLDESGFELHLTVPPNASADVVLPDGTAFVAGSGIHSWNVSKNCLDEGADTCLNPFNLGRRSL